MSTILTTGYSSLLMSGRVTAIRPTQYTVPNGLIAYWGFDTDCLDFAFATARDLVPSGSFNNVGTLNGLPASTLRHGAIGQALLFDGTTSYVSILNFPSTYDFNGGFTICGWVNPTGNLTAANLPNMFSNWQFQTVGAVANHGIFIGAGQTVDNDLRFNYRNNGSDVFNVVSGAAVFTPGVWQFVCASYDPSLAANNALVYWNGVIKGTATASTTFAITGRPFVIGCLSPSDSPNTFQRFFPGMIDDVRIYNRGLSPIEVLGLYRAGLAGRRDDMLNFSMSAQTDELPVIFLPAAGGFVPKFRKSFSQIGGRVGSRQIVSR